MHILHIVYVYNVYTILTWQVRELIEELVLHAGELVVGVVRGGRGRRWLPLLLFGRPAEPRPRHADQSHRCSVKSKESRRQMVSDFANSGTFVSLFRCVLVSNFILRDLSPACNLFNPLSLAPLSCLSPFIHS